MFEALVAEKEKENWVGSPSVSYIQLREYIPAKASAPLIIRNTIKGHIGNDTETNEAEEEKQI